MSPKKRFLFIRSNGDHIQGTTWAHGTWKHAEPETKPEHIWDKETRPPLGLLHLKADNSALFRAQRKVANYKPNGIYHVYWDDFGLQGVYDLLMVISTSSQIVSVPGFCEHAIVSEFLHVR